MKKDNQGPKMGWYLAEGVRAFWEWVRSYPFSLRYRTSQAGAGDPVLVIPGLLGSDLLTGRLRNFLSRMGYKAYPWGLGVNLADIERDEAELKKLVMAIHEAHKAKITIVGWSLGGIYAREIAKAHPDIINLVITICSPFKLRDEPNYASGLVNYLYRRRHGANVPTDRYVEMRKQAPVSTVAIYSKTDGIVPWQTCMEDVSELHINKEVQCGHIASIYNKSVLIIIADALGKTDRK